MAAISNASILGVGKYFINFAKENSWTNKQLMTYSVYTELSMLFYKFWIKRNLFAIMTFFITLSIPHLYDFFDTSKKP